MKALIWQVLFVITFAISIVFVVFGLYEQIVGPARAEELLRKIRFPLNYNSAFIVGLVCVVSALLLYLFRGKFK